MSIGRLRERTFHLPARIDWVDEFPANALAKFRCMPQHPTADGGMVHAESSFGHDFLKVTQRQAIAQYRLMSDLSQT